MLSLQTRRTQNKRIMIGKRFFLSGIVAMMVAGACLSGCGPQSTRRAPFLFPLPTDVDEMDAVRSRVHRVSALFHDLSFGMQQAQVIGEIGEPNEVVSEAAQFRSLGVSSTASILAWQRGPVTAYLVFEDSNGVLCRVLFADRQTAMLTERLLPSSLLDELVISRGMSQMEVLVLLGRPAGVLMRIPDSPPDHYRMDYNCDEGDGNLLRITLSRSTDRVVGIVSVAVIE